MTALSQLPLAALRQLTAQDSDDALVGQTGAPSQGQPSGAAQLLAAIAGGTQIPPSIVAQINANPQGGIPTNPPGQLGVTPPPNPTANPPAGLPPLAQAITQGAVPNSLGSPGPFGPSQAPPPGPAAGLSPQQPPPPTGALDPNSANPAPLAGTGHVAKQPAGPANPSEVPARGGAGTGRQRPQTGCDWRQSGQRSADRRQLVRSEPARPVRIQPQRYGRCHSDGKCRRGRSHRQGAHVGLELPQPGLRRAVQRRRSRGRRPRPAQRAVSPMERPSRFRATASNGPARRHRKNWPPCRPTSGVRFSRTTPGFSTTGPTMRMLPPRRSAGTATFR